MEVQSNFFLHLIDQTNLKMNDQDAQYSLLFLCLLILFSCSDDKKPRLYDKSNFPPLIEVEEEQSETILDHFKWNGWRLAGVTKNPSNSEVEYNSDGNIRRVEVFGSDPYRVFFNYEDDTLRSIVRTFSSGSPNKRYELGYLNGVLNSITDSVGTAYLTFDKRGNLTKVERPGSGDEVHIYYSSNYSPYYALPEPYLLYRNSILVRFITGPTLEMGVNDRISYAVIETATGDTLRSRIETPGLYSGRFLTRRGTVIYSYEQGSIFE